MESKVVSPELIATNSKGINNLDAPTKLKFPVYLRFIDFVEEDEFHRSLGARLFKVSLLITSDCEGIYNIDLGAIDRKARTLRS